MGLTVKEKEHWKTRITGRIDHAIELLYASEPHFNERIRKEAEDLAWESLGLKELHQECQEIERTIAEQDKKRQTAWIQMQSVVAEIPHYKGWKPYRLPEDVSAAVKLRSRVHERELLEASEIGREILRLQHEREELLDAVWLATSPAQIKELWPRFAKVLNWQEPEFRQAALSVALPADES